MNNREYFSFFQSFLEQLVKIRERDPKSATALLWAIVQYGITRQEPTFEEDEFIADVAWVNLRIVLEKQWILFENGSQKKQKRSKSEAKQKQTKSNENAIEKQSESKSRVNNKEQNNKDKNSKEKKVNSKKEEEDKEEVIDNIVTDNDVLSFSSCNDYSTLENDAWSEQVMMTLHLTPEQYKTMLKSFVGEQIIKNTSHISEQDIRNHFFSWLKIQISKPQTNNNNEDNRTTDCGESARDRSIREANESIERTFAAIDARRLQQNNEEVPDIILPW